MSSVTWVTPAGSLGTIPEGVFYQIPIEANSDGTRVFFRLIAGELPDGIQVTANGSIEGTPRTVIKVQGVPLEVAEDVTSTFVIRAYTQKLVNGAFVIDRLADRTFAITVTGQDFPEFVTPSGSLGAVYDASQVSFLVEYTDSDPNDRVIVRLIGGELPPGLTLDRQTGEISGIVTPMTGLPVSALPGYDASQWDQFPFDFPDIKSISRNYQFTLEITDGKQSNTRSFSIFVYSRDSLRADTTQVTADNTFVTADQGPLSTPILVTPPGDLGVVRSDNFFAFQFEGIDFDGDLLEFTVTTGAGIGFDETLYDADGIGFDRGAFSLPPGLAINPFTGWFTGYIPDQGATEFTYTFAVRVQKRFTPTIISPFTYFTITITGNIDTEVVWLTPADLGTLDNGAISALSVAARNIGNRSLQYRLRSGSDSKLPQGLSLLPSGNIVGRVSFNTFALDRGATTFDEQLATRLDLEPTTFDSTYQFTVNAFAPSTEQVGFEVTGINIIDGGSGYSLANPPVITLSAPPTTINSVQATAGTVTIVDGRITQIAVGNPGRGYSSPPTVSISSFDGSGAVAVAVVSQSSASNAVSVFREFTIRVARTFNTPYQSLYIKAMPPLQDRDVVNDLLQDQDIIPISSVYRGDDPNFGVATSVIYQHAFGLDTVALETYVSSLNLNHYWKNLTLGPIRTARALDSNGNVLYEVVYSEIVDNLVNAQGTSVGKVVELDYAVDVDGTIVDKVYPNSLVNMRDQVIATVGQISPLLPLWMLSTQEDGQILGFTPAWVIAYVRPGEAARIAYNIRTKFETPLNRVDFKVDRYELDRSQTWLYDTTTENFEPSPAQATTFDRFDRPLGLDFIGNVDYATTLPFVEIDYQTLESILLRGGIDGEIGRQLNGRTLVFQRQEGFSDLTPDEAFTRILFPYDSTGFDRDGTTYDGAETIPNSQRLGIWEITVDADGIVFLTFVQNATTDDYVRITRGKTFINELLYLPEFPEPGLTRVNWQYVPQQVTTETVFDGGSTRFIAPADRWTDTDQFDKYLVFPKRTILG